MLAEELEVLDVDSPLWPAVRPLLDAALLLEQNDESFSWYGWNRQQVQAFLQSLPQHCSIVAGIWDVIGGESGQEEQEILVLGCVGEVKNGEVSSIRTFEALTSAGLKPVKELEPGIDDAVDIMQVVKRVVAPVAWAIFTNKVTWDEWIFGSADDGSVVDKAALLSSLARQGHCVLMGSQAAHHQ